MTVLAAHRHVEGKELIDSDAALLDFLTGPVPPNRLIAKPTKQKTVLPRRDAALDPLLMAAAAASGPHVTRNHYHHDFFPGVMLPTGEGSWDWTRFNGSTTTPGKGPQGEKHYRYVSKQAPRRERMLRGEIPWEEPHIPPSQSTAVKPSPSTRPLRTLAIDRSPSTPLVVQCMARTRVPTPHGEVFLHLYHNNKDDKEHLAVVIDPAQLLPSDDPIVKTRSELGVQDIRSQSLDKKWSDDETEMDRIVRGAYVGRLSRQSGSAASTSSSPRTSTRSNIHIPSPLMRIHSECFTGETIGSMRCDCGEQLDEAIRRIFEPTVITPSQTSISSITLPPRGLLIYLRQEGRSIGLLSKLRAYNLQDMGYDTVEANEMLGFGADQRGYGVVGGILHDLVPDTESTGVRLLTNNPLKVQALEKEGVRVVERVEMVPRSWSEREQSINASSISQPSNPSLVLGLPIHSSSQPRPPVSQTNSQHYPAHTPYGPDLDKYLRTKVQKMGHVLPSLWDESLDLQHEKEHGDMRDSGDGVRVVEPRGGF